MLDKLRPQVLVIGMALASVALYALNIGSENVASVCVGGLVAVMVKLADHD